MGNILSKTSRILTILVSVIGATVIVFGFQNCAKEKGASESASLNAPVITMTGPIDAGQTLKLIADGSKGILAIRQAAFYGTYPNQYPNYVPSEIEAKAYDNCVVTTNAQGSYLQSKAGKSCPFSMTITVLPSGSSVRFSVLDPSLVSSLDISYADCSSVGTQSIISAGRSMATVNLTCSFASVAGTISVSGVGKETWDVAGSGHRTEDATNIVVGESTHKYGKLVDTLATPAIPLSYTVDGAAVGSLAVDGPYPTSSIWPLLSF